MGVRVDEPREHPAAGQIVEDLYPGGRQRPHAKRGDHSVRDEQIALDVHPLRGVEEMHSRKEEAFGGQRATGKPGRGGTWTGVHPTFPFGLTGLV